MRKMAILALLVATLVFGTGVQALAEPLTNQQQQDLNEKELKISEAERKYAELQNKVDELDMQIQPIVLAIEENDAKIVTLNGEIEVANEQVEKSKKELDEKEETFRVRMREIYKKNTQQSYIAVLLSSNSLGDLVSKAQAVRKIMSLDKQIIDELNVKQKAYDEQLAALNTKMKELEDLNKDNKAKLSDLNKKKEDQLVYIKKAKEEYKKLSSDLVATERRLYKPFENIINNSNSTINDLNNSISTLTALQKSVKTPEVDSEIVNLVKKAKTLVKQKEIELANANKVKESTPSTTPKSTPSNEATTGYTPAPASASAILNIAYSKLGAEYVWGATGPNVFDCSGFTQYVYRQAGISISRTTFTQINDGVAVSYANLQPGDLVLTSPGHIGIYVGGGQMIHAPQTGDVIKVSKIWSFYAARRIL